jgi:opacity protein-like surface antigen
VWRWDEEAASHLTLSDQTSFVWGGRVGYAPIDAFSVEGIILTGTNEGTIAFTTGPESLRLTQTELSTVINFQSIVSRKVYPFLNLGIGLSFRSGGGKVDDEAVFDDTKFTFHIGGGIKVEVTPRAALRFNVRDTFFSDTQVGGGNLESQVTVDSVELSVGLEYRFPLGASGGSGRLR